MTSIGNLDKKNALEFSQIAWGKIQGIYQSIIQHPFNQEMILGTLDKKKFNYYIAQDYIFLQALAKSLSIIAGRLNKDKDSIMFMRLAKGTMAASREIVLPFLKEEQHYNGLSIGCLAYTNYLLQICTIQPTELAVAAIVPCYWIYHEVGKYIIKRTGSNNNFNKWIDTYSREEFNQNLVEIVSAFDTLALKATKEMQQKMYDEFYKSSVLEWHFWNDAYNMRNYDNLNFR